MGMVPAVARRPLQLDSFFPGEDPNQPSPTLARMAQGQPQLGSEYLDPSQVPMSIGGTTMGHAITPGANGVRGVVIPHVSPGGVPSGFNPNRLQRVQVEIDPHLHRGNNIISLGALTDAMVKRAGAEVATVIPYANTMPEHRRRASATFEVIASEAGPGQVTHDDDELMAVAPGVPQPARPTRPPMAAPLPQPAAQTPVTTHSPPAVASFAPPKKRTPLQAFGAMRQAPPVETVDAIQPVTQVVEQVRPPRYKAQVEIEHFGTTTAFFHDIIKQPGQLILVYDTRYEYGTKWFPSKQQDAPMAILIEGDDTIYLVHTTGFEYAHEGKEFCVLSVEKTGPVAAME